jgi:hypothetical protein
MYLKASDLLVGLMMIGFGILGLFLASRAIDSEMYLFGLSLAGFAVLFVAGQARRVYGGARSVAHD